MIRRSVVTVILLPIFLIGMAFPALAKMPPFEVDVVVENGAVLIGVRVVGFQESSVPPDGFDPAHLDGLLALYPTSDLDSRGRPIDHGNAVPVDLEWSGEPGVYEGRVTLGTKGTWAVVPFPTSIEFDPDSATHESYPATLYFDAPAEGTSMLAVAGGVGVLIAVGAFIFERRRRSGLEIRAPRSASASSYRRRSGLDESP